MYHTITHITTKNDSGVWAKQVIEEIAEPMLEHRDLGLGHWNRIGPIVCHGPTGEVVFGRSAHRDMVSQKLFKLL
jgi:hypothetical protein